MVTTGRNDFGADDSLYTVLMADRKDAPQTLVNCITPSTWSDNLHVLPASPLLEGAERELMGVAGAPYRLADPLSRILVTPQDMGDNSNMLSLVRLQLFFTDNRNTKNTQIRGIDPVL